MNNMTDEEILNLFQAMDNKVEALFDIVQRILISNPEIRNKVAYYSFKEKYGDKLKIYDSAASKLFKVDNYDFTEMCYEMCCDHPENLSEEEVISYMTSIGDAIIRKVENNEPLPPEYEEVLSEYLKNIQESDK